MWSKVNQLLHPRHVEADSDLVTADTFNNHYASIATDSMYTKTACKLCVTHCSDNFSEFGVFKMLDIMHNTATGPDAIPAWYLNLAAPHICEALTFLLNFLVKSFTVPVQ